MQVISLDAVAGDDLQFPISVTQNGGIYNLTSCAFHLVIKQFQTDPDASAPVNVVVTSHTSPLTGQSFIPVVGTSTSSLFGQYYYQFIFVNSSGIKMTFLGGTITFSANLLQSLSSSENILSNIKSSGTTYPINVDLKVGHPLALNIN